MLSKQNCGTRFLTDIHASPEVNHDCIWTGELIKSSLAPFASFDKTSCLMNKVENWRSWNCSPNSWKIWVFFSPWKCQIFSVLHNADFVNYLKLGKFKNFTGLLECWSRSIKWILFQHNCQQPYFGISANPASYSSENIERKIRLSLKFTYAQNCPLKDHLLLGW